MGCRYDRGGEVILLAALASSREWPRGVGGDGERWGGKAISNIWRGLVIGGVCEAEEREGDGMSTGILRRMEIEPLGMMLVGLHDGSLTYV